MRRQAAWWCRATPSVARVGFERKQGQCPTLITRNSSLSQAQSVTCDERHLRSRLLARHQSALPRVLAGAVTVAGMHPHVSESSAGKQGGGTRAPGVEGWARWGSGASIVKADHYAQKAYACRQAGGRLHQWAVYAQQPPNPFDLLQLPVCSCLYAAHLPAASVRMSTVAPRTMRRGFPGPPYTRPAVREGRLKGPASGRVGWRRASG